jgi:hypothetical protein
MVACRIWFFNRTNVPSSLSAGAQNVDTSTLGIPVGNWPTSGCNINQFFAPQNLIFGSLLLPFTLLPHR